MPTPILEVADVRKRYGKTVALDGVSFGVNEGEMFGLLGPNGAGKTTLISILCGLTDADGGAVRLFGKPFRRSDVESRRLVGIGTQDLSIYPDLTARENLRFFGKLYGLGGGDLEQRSAELLTAVGLTDRANDRSGTFSGGMKRRLNLAVAVVHRPRLLFLDEPTTGVDPQSRNNIFQQVKALNGAGMTVIYTSHYMEEVQKLCRRIAILESGKLLACDTLPQLLKRLDATIRLTTSATPALAEQFAALPGVKRVNLTPQPPSLRGKGEQEGTSPSPQRGGVGEGFSTVELVVEDLPSAVARVATACAAAGVELTTLTTREPTLERVFLHLTGRELRD
jgi:ABC-2 type transport system ATP-binding protein